MPPHGSCGRSAGRCRHWSGAPCARRSELPCQLRARARGASRKQNNKRNLGGSGAPGAATCVRATNNKYNETDETDPTAEQPSRSDRAERARRGRNKLPNTRELFVGSLFAPDGLRLHAAGVPGQTWFGRAPGQDKRRPLAQNDLTPLMMTMEVLVSIRGACCKERPNARPSPAWFLVHVKLSDFGRACSDAAPASAGWSEA